MIMRLGRTRAIRNENFFSPMVRLGNVVFDFLLNSLRTLLAETCVLRHETGTNEKLFYVKKSSAEHHVQKFNTSQSSTMHC